MGRNPLIIQLIELFSGLKLYVKLIGFTMSDYTNGLTAKKLIQYIATDYVELSHEKIAWQRDDHMKICREWLKKRTAEIVLDKS